MSKYPLKFRVTRPGERVLVGYDPDLGNEVWETLPDYDVPVFSYAVVRTEEGIEAGHLRMVDRLEVIAPTSSLVGAGHVLIDGEKWYRDGSPTSYGNNPYFNPGLETHYYTRYQPDV